MEIAGRKVLVTGGAGFVGSNVCERLLQEGAEVVAYDNLSSGSMKNVEALSSNKGFKFVKGDVLDFQLLDNTIKENGIDTVVHLAANPDIRKGLAQTDLDLNQGPVATRNVLEAMRKNDAETIMFSSSSAVYGIASVKPTPENYGPLRPISLYGASKLASEGLITAFSHVFGMSEMPSFLLLPILLLALLLSFLRAFFYLLYDLSKLLFKRFPDKLLRQRICSCCYAYLCCISPR